MVNVNGEWAESNLDLVAFFFTTPNHDSLAKHREPQTRRTTGNWRSLLFSVGDLKVGFTTGGGGGGGAETAEALQKPPETQKQPPETQKQPSEKQKQPSEKQKQPSKKQKRPPEQPRSSEEHDPPQKPGPSLDS
ncbi:hypothetical protein JOB18_039769 [Solea senegalensis]|uniref:Uncharacterized protein n=1 Tax=Solea senegalensis TaxID=28829 RepID=A0AAV6QZH7_SOLSE|nr:hypothetical protein JOB18_039769 [Solea senegalensis]